MRRSRCNLAPRVKVEQLDRHLLNRGACAIALLRPPFSTQRVKPWRWVLRGNVGSGAESLYLVDPVERNIEPGASLVFDHRDLDGALAHEHLLHPAV